MNDGFWYSLKPRHYFFIGFFFGFLFPFITSVTLVWENVETTDIRDYYLLHLSNPLLLVIDTAPIVLGVFSFIIGLRQEKLKIIYENLYNVNKVTSSFFPYQFLDILNKSDIGNIKPGDYIDKELTVLFTDIRDYTALSDSMSSGDTLTFLNDYFSNLAPCIERNNGFIDKYIGDSIMAIFPDSPKDALMAAIEMKRELEKFNVGRALNGKAVIRTGFGLHYGKASLGTIGNSSRMQTTVIGDTVNLAARIESWTKLFRSWILMSEIVAIKLAEYKEFHIREIDIVRIKGKRNTMSIYECYDTDPKDIIEIKNAYKFDLIMAMSMFRDNEFKEAERIFRECSQQCPSDPLPIIYLNRCHEKKVEIMDISESKKKKSVLLVDDNEMIINLTEKFLRKNNINVTSTYNALQALSIMDNFVPDVVFLDYHLPGQDGLELSQELREVIKYKNLPTKIILMTADEEVNHSELIRTGLIDAFLQKPFYEEDVIGKFKEVTRDTLDQEDG